MSQLPAFMQGYAGRNLAQTLRENIGSGSPPMLSIEGGQFTLHWPDGESLRAGAHDPKVGLYIDAIVIDANGKKSKTYFGRDANGQLKKYDPANPSPPVCFSDNGIGPSTQAGEPQALTCASCPQNVMGSAVSLKGKPAQACRDSIKAAIVVPEYPDDVFLLRIPPNSFKHLRTLTDWCAKSKVNLEQVVTRIYFEQGVQGTLMFAAVNYVQDEAIFRKITQTLADKATDQLVGRTDHPREGLALPPAQAPAALPPPSQPEAAFQPQPMAVPAAVAPFTPTVPPSAATMAPVPSVSPSEPPKRRRRTAEQIAADKAAEAAPVPQNGAPVAPFRPAATDTPATQFGMTAGVAPDPALSQAIDSIFGQP